MPHANVRKFRPYCPECKDYFTLMAVVPKGADVETYIRESVARHDHKAFAESKSQHLRIRVGQQKQRKK